MDSHQQAEQAIENWRQALAENAYTRNEDFQEILKTHFGERLNAIESGLIEFGLDVSTDLPGVVAENHLNLPVCENGVVTHHKTYEQVGNAIYGTGLMALANTPGRLTEALAFFYLSSHLGEAGHNCPIACNVGMLRVLGKNPHLPGASSVIARMLAPSYRENFTAAQFVTELQGGSDVGQNAVRAEKDSEGNWHISGEKWFCSNCHADVILLTARVDDSNYGTEGLGLFFVPARLNDSEHNHFHIRLLKDKLGTRTMATGEIEFNGAVAYPLDPLEGSFKVLMTDVLHISRLFNAVCVAGMAQQAVTIATEYAKQRVAFGKPLSEFPVIQQELKALHETQRHLNATVFQVAALQDQFDTGKFEDAVLLRMLVNLNKSYTAKVGVDQVRHSIDLLAGNGMVNQFSELPRLMCDMLVCENWEGTHHILEAQILNDIVKNQGDERFVAYIEYLGGETSEIKACFEKLAELPTAEKSCYLPELMMKMGKVLAT